MPWWAIPVIVAAAGAMHVFSLATQNRGPLIWFLDWLKQRRER